MDLQQICKGKKEALGLTQQDISERAGIPASTVKTFFSHISKAPSVYTVGPICKVLGISLDEYFAISEHLTPTEESLKVQQAEMQERLRLKAHTIETLETVLRSKRHTIYNLIVIIILLVVWCISMDLSCLDVGIFRR